MKNTENSESKLGIKNSLITLSGVIALFIMLLIFGVYFVFFNKIFYNVSFNKYGVQADLGVSSLDLKLLRNGIISFFMLLRVSLQTKVTIAGEEVNFYTEDELSHMEDVRVFFVVFLFVIVITALVFGLAIANFLKTRKKINYSKILGLQLIIVPAVFLLLVSIIASFILTDWENTFELFHKIFFPQGNWQFDANSLMLKMLPGGIFLDGAIFIIVCWVLTCLSFIATGIILLMRSRKRKNKKLVVTDSVLIA